MAETTIVFKRIGFLHWARDYMGRVQYDLARSFLKPISKEELGISSSDIEIARTPALALNKVIAENYNVDPASVVITSGATMSIFAIFSAILEKGDEILLEVPNYESLYRIPRRLGATIKVLEREYERGFQIDLEELERKIGKNTKAIVVTNLHNPSGQAINQDKMTAIGQIARDYKSLVISVEVYLDNAFISDLKPAVTCGDNMISINSFKVYGLDEIRVGWFVCNIDKIIDRVGTICSDYIYGSIPAPNESIAQFAFSKRANLLESSRQLVQQNVKIISDWISGTAFEWVEPKGGTICFIKLPQRVDDMQFSNLLRERFSTLVVPGTFFWKKGFIRVSFGIDQDMLRKGLDNITTALESFK